MRKFILVSLMFASSAVANTFPITNSTSCVCTGNYAAYGQCKTDAKTYFTLYSFDGSRVYGDPIAVGGTGKIFEYKSGGETLTDLGVRADQAPSYPTELGGDVLKAGHAYVLTVNNYRTGGFDHLQLSAQNPCA